ncbi:MAG: hypothetical protein AAGC47_00135 [Bacteroidota bacterium]
MLSKFIRKTIKPVLILGGVGTALAGANAFFPEWTTENIQELEWNQSYTIFVQHWGMMVCLMGIFMVAAAFKESWRTPIILYGLLEKGFMVYLVGSNLSEFYSAGFYIPAMIDSFLTVYSITYLLSLRSLSQT